MEAHIQWDNVIVPALVSIFILIMGKSVNKHINSQEKAEWKDKNLKFSRHIGEVVWKKASCNLIKTRAIFNIFVAMNNLVGDK